MKKIIPVVALLIIILNAHSKTSVTIPSNAIRFRVIADSNEEVAIAENIESKIVTTEEELEGFNIVRSILSEVVSVDEISYKDVQSYFGILYQNNTRKWICR